MRVYVGCFGNGKRDQHVYSCFTHIDNHINNHIWLIYAGKELGFDNTKGDVADKQRQQKQAQLTYPLVNYSITMENHHF
jgi:hypothetical protein